MGEEIHIGDRVRVRMEAKGSRSDGWFEGKVIRIDPYSSHRSFYWVEFDTDARSILGISHISVLNPKNIVKT